MFRDTYSRSAISRIIRCVWRYGSSRSSAGDSGDAPAVPAGAVAIECTELLDLGDQDAQVGALAQDVVDLAQQVAHRGGSPRAQ